MHSNKPSWYTVLDIFDKLSRSRKGVTGEQLNIKNTQPKIYIG